MVYVVDLAFMQNVFTMAIDPTMLTNANHMTTSLMNPIVLANHLRPLQVPLPPPFPYQQLLYQSPAFP